MRLWLLRYLTTLIIYYINSQIVISLVSRERIKGNNSYMWTNIYGFKGKNCVRLNLGYQIYTLCDNIHEQSNIKALTI